MKDDEVHEIDEASRDLSARIERLAVHLERLNLKDYIDLVQNPRKLLMVNFMAGVARGLGMALGFTILGAFVIYLLTRTFIINLPVVGGFIAELVKIVQTELR